MIRNVFGKPVTQSTAEDFPEFELVYTLDLICRHGLAKMALAMKNSQGTGATEVAALKLKAQCELDFQGFTQGWLYNATGSALNLVDSRNWNEGGLISNPLPLRIDNGQWGMFIQDKPNYEPADRSGAVLYDGVNSEGNHCYWCVAWKSHGTWNLTQTNVHVKIVRDTDWDEDKSWESVRVAIQESCSLHKAKHEGLYSIVSTSYGRRAVFEALLTLETTSNY